MRDGWKAEENGSSDMDPSGVPLSRVPRPRVLEISKLCIYAIWIVVR